MTNITRILTQKMSSTTHVFTKKKLWSIALLFIVFSVGISATLINSIKATVPTAHPLTYTPAGPWYITCTGLTADFYVNDASQCMIILHGTGVVIAGICYTGALYFASFDDARNWLWPPPATPPSIPSTRVWPPAIPPSYPSTQMPAPSNGVNSIESLTTPPTLQATPVSTLEIALYVIIAAAIVSGSLVILLMVRQKRK